MKNYLFTITVALAAILISSCNDSEEVDPVIESFSADKETNITFGEKINMRMIATDPGNAHLTYEWSATGGTISETGERATWTAPDQIGRYTIACLIGNGKKKIAESKEMQVIGSDFNFFTGAKAGWFLQGAKMSYTDGIGRLSATAEGASASVYFLKTPAILNVPFSYKTKIAVDNVDFTPESRGTLFIHTSFLHITPYPGPYLSSITLRLMPDLGIWHVLAYVMQNETSANVITLAGNASGSMDAFTTANRFHTVGVTITADKTFIFHLDGEEVYRTAILATDPVYSRDLVVDKIQYTASLFGFTRNLLFDEFILTTDETILK